jgi:hypothetical protein
VDRLEWDRLQGGFGHVCCYGIAMVLLLSAFSMVVLEV